MWTRKPPPEQALVQPVGSTPVDLGSQLEDLITHVLRCERWASFDDRLDLALSVERFRKQPSAGEDESGAA